MHKLSIEEYQGKMIMRVEKEAMCVYNHNDSVSVGDNLFNIDNNKLDSTIAGRFVRLSSKLFNEVFDGEEKLSELGDKADAFEQELKAQCKMLRDECVATFSPT